MEGAKFVTESLRDKIIKYFKENAENSNTKISEVFNIKKHVVDKIIDDYLKPKSQAIMPENVEHELKCQEEFFVGVWNGEKGFELRKNDRNYEIGDILFLREYDIKTDTYSGREVYAGVTYILDLADWDKPDFVIMSIRVTKKVKNGRKVAL